MANIQKENGYTSIANEFLEAMLKISLPDYQRRVFETIIRKTWGWQKKKDVISLSQIMSLTGISRPNVCKALRFLKDKKMIIRDDDGMTQIQKDFELWGVSNGTQGECLMRHVSNEITPSVPRDTKRVSNGTHTKESKETIQKKYRKEPKTPSAEGGLFPPGDWTDSKFREVREDWNGRRTQTAHPFDVAVYYFLKFHERHRSVTDLEMERTREGVWKKEQKTWLFISKLDPLDDFVTTAICDMALKGEVIDEPIPFFRWAKKEYQGYEV